MSLVPTLNLELILILLQDPAMRSVEQSVQAYICVWFLGCVKFLASVERKLKISRLVAAFFLVMCVACFIFIGSTWLVALQRYQND